MKVSLLSRDPDRFFVWIGNNSHYFTFRGPLMSKSIQIREGLGCSLARRSVRSSESALCLIRKYAKTVKQSGMTARIIQAARVKMCLSLVVAPVSHISRLADCQLDLSMERQSFTSINMGPPSSSQIGEGAQGQTRSQLGWILVMACRNEVLTNYLLIKASMNEQISRETHKETRQEIWSQFTTCSFFLNLKNYFSKLYRF